jgi:hypothetical protein
VFCFSGQSFLYQPHQFAVFDSGAPEFFSWKFPNLADNAGIHGAMSQDQDIFSLPQLRQGKDILIMGHGAMNSSIVCQVRKLPREEFWSAGIENCKLMRLV